MITKEMANQFFFTDFVRTPTYVELQKSINVKYPLKSQDEDYPDAYWDELNTAVSRLLIMALAMNLPIEKGANIQLTEVTHDRAVQSN